MKAHEHHEWVSEFSFRCITVHETETCSMSFPVCAAFCWSVVVVDEECRQ